MIFKMKIFCSNFVQKSKYLISVSFSGWSCCCWSEEASADSTPSWGRLSGMGGRCCILHPLLALELDTKFSWCDVCADCCPRRRTGTTTAWTPAWRAARARGGAGGGVAQRETIMRWTVVMFMCFSSKCNVSLYFRQLHLLTKKVDYKNSRRKIEPRPLFVKWEHLHNVTWSVPEHFVYINVPQPSSHYFCAVSCSGKTSEINDCLAARRALSR